MSLENANQVILEGQRTIGMKPGDIDKLSISQSSSSSFSVDNISLQNDVNGGQVPEDHIINTSVIDNGSGLQGQSTVQNDVVGGGEVYPSQVPEPVVEPVSEVQSNIFDMPQKDAIQSSILQPEMIPEPSSFQPSVYPEQQPVSEPGVNVLGESDNSFAEQAPLVSEIPSYQEPKVVQQSQDMIYQQKDESNIPLDTPQTFYERQVDQDTQGGFTNMPMDGVRTSTDPVVIMLDEAIRTVTERKEISNNLMAENQVLRDENSNLRIEIDRLKQQMIELNNKVLIADAQRQAAEQTLAGARMAESGMVNNGPARVYQPQSTPQTSYYQQSA